MNKNIAVIGAGNVGARHLQALAHLPYSLRIQIVEPDPRAQRIAKERFNSILPEKKDADLELLSSLTDLHPRSDLSIIATTSKGRVDIIDRLLTIGHKRLLIEKIVCQSKNEYDRLLTIISQKNAKAWVNCVYRDYPFYQEIAGLLRGRSDIAFSAVGSNNGLGCNAIHLIDVFCMICGDSQGIKLSGDNLHKEILTNNKGDDFVEFAGSITVKTNNGNYASINFHPEIPPFSLLINILSQGIKIVIDDRGALAKVFISKEENDWQWEDYDYKELVVSRLTTGIAQSILESDECNLPKVGDLYQIHKELFRIFNRHIKKITSKSVSICPIT